MNKFSLFDSVKTAIMVTNHDRRVCFTNQHLDSLLGCIPEGTFLSQTFLDPIFINQPCSDHLQHNTEINGIAVTVEVKSYSADTHEYFVLTIIPTTSTDDIVTVLTQLAEALSSGELETQLNVLNPTSKEAEALSQVNEALNELKTQFDQIHETVTSISECDLRVTVPGTQSSGELGNLITRLSITVSNLTETVRQSIHSSKTIAATTTDIVEQNTQLAARTSDQADAIQTTSANMNELSSKVAQMAENSNAAYEQGQHAIELAHKGREAMGHVVHSMEEIEQNATEVSNIIKLIKEISLQTNILALNANVEAAHAGEYGRGFSIVAAEVRALAQRSNDAANQIKSLIEKSVESAVNGKSLVSNADNRMLNILNEVTATGSQVRAINESANEQQVGINDANDALIRIDEITQNNHLLVEDLAQNTKELHRQALYLEDSSRVFFISDSELSHPIHIRAKDFALNATEQIGARMETLIQDGRITIEQLFNFTYNEIKNTNPKKHSTPYDSICDRILPSIQEPILIEEKGFVYAITADINGYVPTHNNCFCQPLTGNPKKDLAGNRTKRIFSDRVGAQVGNHTDDFKLQTYRRDTGELMFDMSVPIYVQGEHWGGFRIGYRIE